MMKKTEENIMILKKLGFTCDMDRSKDPRDEDWYSLECSWGFRLDGVRDLKQLFKNALDHENDED